MADKRATPEAPQEPTSDARGKKRAAPTIDLTATELPREPAPEDSPPRVADAQSPPPPEQPAARKGAWAGNLGGLAIAAGAGAACMVLILFGFWLAGMLPIANTGAAGANAQQTALEKQVEAIGQRVAAVETSLARRPAGDAGVADKLTAADGAMKSLGVALAALNRRSDETAANAANAQKAADAASKAVVELQAAMKDVATSSQASAPRADIEALEKRMAALETSVKSQRDTIARNSGNDTAARLVLSAVMLRDAVVDGAPFAAELATAKSLGGDDKALAALAPFAATGVPDKKTLARELTALMPGMLKVSEAKAPAGGFLEKLEANASRLVKVRPLNAPQGDDVSTVLARIEVDTANADIDGALADLAKLPEKVRMPAGVWIERAKARQAAAGAARQFATDAVRSLAAKAAPQ